MDESDFISRKISGKCFQSMGLTSSVLKGIFKKGYKQPSPIQRKCIPLILEGKDVVGMSRTGSGKSAAFVIPLINKLKCHSAQMGARGLILSPSRELAQQTFKYCKDIGKYTDLRVCMFVGGGSMEDQFSHMANNPDIIIATPGRLLHVLIETNIALSRIEYVVFDEAEILFKIPKTRQTILFSATLPKSLVEFAKAGLNDPKLIRLDVDTKISEDLQMGFFHVQSHYKDAALLFLLDRAIPKKQSTIVFVATKHHVEYLHEFLLSMNIPNGYIYGSLDQEARNINIQNFRLGKVKILIVTDVAARGIDIPLLDNVINYNFPDKCKVFVHRVGRVARNGKLGKSYSLISTEELPYVLDLQLFLGRDFILDQTNYKTTDLIFGEIPQSLLDSQNEYVLKKQVENSNLASLLNVAHNAFKLYSRSRTPSSNESHKKSKEIISMTKVKVHPWIVNLIDKTEIERADILTSIKKFKPQETIFEATKKTNSDKALLIMKDKRNREQRSELKKRFYEDNKIKSYRDEEFYIPSMPKDTNTEKGYSISKNTFSEQAQSSIVDFSMGDELDKMKQHQQALKWNKKKRKYVKETVGADNKKRIKTESGASIPASYKTNAFAQWTKKHKISVPRVGEAEISNKLSFRKQRKPQEEDAGKKNRKERRGKGELKNIDQIHKERKTKERMKMKNVKGRSKSKPNKQKRK